MGRAFASFSLFARLTKLWNMMAVASILGWFVRKFGDYSIQIQIQIQIQMQIQIQTESGEQAGSAADEVSEDDRARKLSRRGEIETLR